MAAYIGPLRGRESAADLVLQGNCMAVDERRGCACGELRHPMMRGSRRAWSQAPRDCAHRTGTKRTGATGAGAHHRPAPGSAGAHHALGGRGGEHGGNCAPAPLGWGHRAPVAGALARQRWEPSARTQRGRTVGGSPQIRPAGTDHARADLPDHRAGLRNSGHLRPPNQPVERSRIGR